MVTVLSSCCGSGTPALAPSCQCFCLSCCEIRGIVVPYGRVVIARSFPLLADKVAKLMGPDELLEGLATGAAPPPIITLPDRAVIDPQFHRSVRRRRLA